MEHEDGMSVALYTHWSGSHMRETLAAALDRGRGRWGDATYLTRIIFSEMIQSDVLGETGYGIEPMQTGSTSYCEARPGYDLIVSADYSTVQGDNDGTGEVLDFEDFILKFKSDGKDS